MEPQQDILVEAQALTKEYKRSGAGGVHGAPTARVVDGVSFTIRRGETLGLVGESGSGKSTVARMLLRLIEPTAGSVRFAAPAGHAGQGDRPGNHPGDPVYQDVLAASPAHLRALRRRMQIVFQDPYAALNPRMTVRRILAEPFAIHKEKPAGGLEARLAEMLASVGLDPSALPRYPHEFSGGQRQRINIARALALEPEFLVLDEPVSALDVSVGAQVINLLRDLQRAHNLTYLFISHSMPLVRYLANRVAVLQHGRLVELGDVLEVCDHPCEHYTQELIAATPHLPA
jgi:ABC-type oligopeptide transport system ATPase subunit